MLQNQLSYHVITFGCQMNTADSQELSAHLWDRGFAPTETLEDASVVLVNTCTVREHAEQRALSQIGRLRTWREARPQGVLIVAGCAAQRLKDHLPNRFPFIDMVLGAKEMPSLAERMDAVLSERFERLPMPAASAPLERGLRAHVTIMRGCNYSCSYCIVPQVRGREIYRTPEEIVSEIRRAAEAGSKEVLLLGQTVNSYRSEDGAGETVDFADLLGRVEALDGIERIRYMSPHPYYFTPKLVAKLGELRKVCPHVHLPLQSGSDSVLKRMRRNYTRAQYGSVVNDLKNAVPGVAVTTDIIVGFPGESEADFQETLDFVQEIGFDAAYCFKFSPRAGTDAVGLEHPVSEEVKEERLERLLSLTNDGMKKRSAAYHDTRQAVLAEGSENGRLWGRSLTNHKVFFDGPEELLGSTVPVLITSSRMQALEGSLCN